LYKQLVAKNPRLSITICDNANRELSSFNPTLSLTKNQHFKASSPPVGFIALFLQTQGHILISGSEQIQYSPVWHNGSLFVNELISAIKKSQSTVDVSWISLLDELSTQVSSVSPGRQKPYFLIQSSRADFYSKGHYLDKNELPLPMGFEPGEWMLEASAMSDRWKPAYMQRTTEEVILVNLATIVFSGLYSDDGKISKKETERLVLYLDDILEDMLYATDETEVFVEYMSEMIVDVNSDEADHEAIDAAMHYLMKEIGEAELETLFDDVNNMIDNKKSPGFINFIMYAHDVLMSY
jgi:hypothetical protein